MNSVETAPPTFWVGESGVRRSGTSSSSSSSRRIAGRSRRRRASGRRGRSSASARPRSPRRAAVLARGPRPVPAGVRSWGHLARSRRQSADTHLQAGVSEPLTVAADPTTRETTVAAPRLTRLDAAGRRRGVVLMLHGGKERVRTSWSTAAALSWRRARAAAGDHARPARRRASARGCCATASAAGTAAPAPVEDARWALEQVRRDARRRAGRAARALDGRPDRRPRRRRPAGRRRRRPGAVAPGRRARHRADRPAPAWPRTAAATGSPLAAPPRRSSSGPARSPRPRCFATWAGRPLHAAAGARVERARVHLGAVDA